MAARFWVTGGTGNWNSTTNWSATSGGASGASVPGSADTATLNASSGSGTVTLDISPDIQTLTCTGFTGTLAFGTNTISLNSTGTIFTGNTTMTITGTPQIICTNNSATARSITPTAVTEANSISFRFTAGTGTLTLNNGGYRDLDFTDGTNPTGYGGNIVNSVISIYGNFKASTSGMTRTAGTGTYTFAATSGTKTINTAGVIFDNPFTFNGVGGTWQLQAALTSGSTRACTLTNGVLDLNGYTATFGSVSSSNSNARTFAFGSTGKFVLTNTGATLWTTSTSTNLTVTGTNPLIQLTTNSTTGTRGVILGAAGESNSISVDVTAGSDQINLSTTSGAYKNVNFTGFTGTVSFQNSILIFGDWNFGGVTATSGSGTATFSATSGTKTITSNGDSFPGGVTFNGVGGAWVLQDALTSLGALALTNGALNLAGYTATCNNFGSNNSNIRSIAFGTGNIALTGNSANVWTCADLTNFSYTGTPTVNLTYSGSTGTRTISNGGTAGGTEANAVDFNIVAGGDTVTSTTSSIVRNFTVQPAFTGISSTFAAGFVYGNFLLSPSQTTNSSTSAITFAATSGVKTITTNGVAIFRSMTFDGVGGTWQLQGALDFGSGRTLTLTNGTFDANNYSVTGARVASSNSNVRTLGLGSANWTMTGSSAAGTSIEWDFTNSTNLTITGTGLIVLNGPTVAVFQGGGRSWPGLVLDPLVAGTAERWIYGSNTFGSIAGTTLNYSVSFEAGTTQTVNAFNVSGTAGNLVTLKSLTPGTQWNLVKATGSRVVVSFCSITDSNVTPAPGYWFAPISQGNVDGGNNTGWNFGSAGDNSSFMLLM